jgi:hypothetical protein
MVEVTLQFETEQEFERELRGIFEVIAMADEDELSPGDYAAVMQDTAQQAELAYDRQVLGWFLNGDRIIALRSDQ